MCTTLHVKGIKTKSSPFSVFIEEKNILPLLWRFASSSLSLLTLRLYQNLFSLETTDPINETRMRILQIPTRS
ncbi:hypothetical protein YC2023_113315 [Brassica napus]|uniref:Uncharacterized protein n=1 Tax=Brassica oleracea TaxID=3712 RepID=A0A3P6DYM2_BRAOL|nr:unnamed protein product [Brassica oleracea]